MATRKTVASRKKHLVKRSTPPKASKNTTKKASTVLNATDVKFLGVALAEAKAGFKEGGVPVGACLVYHSNGKSKVLGQGRNQFCQKGSVVLHGETDALENAGQRKRTVYQKCTMYTTLSPCAMCCGAMIRAGISRVVIGENKHYTGEEKLLTSRGVQVAVADDAECKSLWDEFSKKSPKVLKALRGK
eukprot:gnl/MRDRNA2_/MRDRNA2_101745_c0_seq1.p1 gnl/MRDRNA2_/MRDRNA2_101745_c0~~gnl/MRDRNA2_/MRDRNA2_101745_c0_seq1.p1  ORF type:complete len:188 (-),score=31.52 gnl/MRDRNA2_/MRDRNA2_101745_c0_seq1:59-622(-)